MTEKDVERPNRDASTPPPAVPAETCDLFLTRVGAAPLEAAGATYESRRFQQAAERLWLAPRELTLDDVRQLTLVDPALGVRARAKQLGWVEPGLDADVQQAKVSFGFLAKFLSDFLNPTFASYRYKQQQLRADLDLAVARLEARVLELEAQAAATTKHVTASADLGFPYAAPGR